MHALLTEDGLSVLSETEHSKYDVTAKLFNWEIQASTRSTRRPPDSLEITTQTLCITITIAMFARYQKAQL